MYTKKAQLIKFENGTLAVILLEEAKYGYLNLEKSDEICEIIKPTEKLVFWIYRGHAGANPLGDSQIIASPPEEKDVEKILANGGICFIETNHLGKISSPSNMRGDRAIVLHFQQEQVEVVAI